MGELFHQTLDSVNEKPLESKGERKGSIELKELCLRKAANIVSESRLWETDEVVTVNAAVVLETLLDSDRNLTVKTVSACIDGGTDNARKTGINEQLAAHNDEDSGSSRVELRWMPDSVKITPYHGMTW